MVKRARSEAKATSKSKTVALVPSQVMLFGTPQLLEDEDAAAYDELLARFRAAIKPVDIIDEMFIVDLANMEWEVLRWRRFKFGLIRSLALKALEGHLRGRLDYELYQNKLVDDLTEVLQDNLPEGKGQDFAQTLAQRCADNESQAVDEVNKIFDGIELDLDRFIQDVRFEKAEELLQEYAQRSPKAVTLINEVLAAAATTMASLTAKALTDQFDYIERIDHLTVVAENRRNAFLREIDRRRAVLAETARRTVREIEDGEFKVIETTPAKGKDAA
jgi:hypothetical protein